MSAVETFPETEIEVRDALPDDAHAISAIYACMYFMAVRPSRKFPPPSMRCVSG